jgi:thiamine biosynthesis lipoprotein
MHRIRLQDAALATSGAYYSRQPGPSGEVSALVNPARHAPHLASGSVSVRARNCRSADALTKVVLFAPPALAERALAACDAVAFVHPPDPSLLENGSAPHRLPPRLAAHAP